MAIADQICVFDEVIDESKPLVLFDEHQTWKRKTIKDFTAKELLVPIFIGGELVYEIPSIDETRAYCADCVAHLWEEVKRFDNPHAYYVDLSQRLFDIKQQMLSDYAAHNEE
jgi:nicotinate phosphoribosyltransferase